VIVPFLLDDPDLKRLDVRDAVLPHLRVLGDLLETYETAYADVDEDAFWSKIGSGFDSLILAPEEVWRWPLLIPSTDWQQHTDGLFAELEKRVQATRRVTTTRCWHEVLEVSETASIEEIRAAYRAKIGQYHPDRVTGLGAEFREIAERRSKEINVAYGEAQKARV
jgi:DnaJ like chaperone protein